MPKGKITDKEAQACFLKLDSTDEAQAEAAFLTLKTYLTDNNKKFRDLIEGSGDLSGIKEKFEAAGRKNRALKAKTKTLEETYTTLKAELNNI